MFPQLPPPIANSRKSKCGNCSCGVDFGDPCASCPSKKWGPEMCVSPPEEEPLEINKKPPQLPNAGEMALNFVSAVKSEVRSRVSGAKNVSEDEIKQRLEICSGCEFYHKPSKRCKKCGCFLKWKTAWRSQKCPIGKW